MKKEILSLGCMLYFSCMAASTWATTIPLDASQDSGAASLYFSANAASTNYGGSEWIHHYNNNANGGSLQQDAFSFFQFDLAGLSSAGLVSATFNAYHRVSDYYNSNPNNNRYYTMKTYQIMSAWDENTVTHSNQPTIGSEAGVVGFQAVAGIYRDAAWEYEDFVKTDLTALVLSWLNGSADNYGFAYKMDNNFLSNGHANMVGTRDNSDALFRPQLELTYAGSENQFASSGNQSVSEPTTLVLLGLSLTGVGYRRRKTA